MSLDHSFLLPHVTICTSASFFFFLFFLLRKINTFLLFCTPLEWVPGAGGVHFFLQGGASLAFIECAMDTQRFCKPFPIHFRGFPDSFKVEGAWGKGLCYLLLSTLYNTFAHNVADLQFSPWNCKENCRTADLGNVVPVFTEIGGAPLQKAQTGRCFRAHIMSSTVAQWTFTHTWYF